VTSRQLIDTAAIGLVVLALLACFHKQLVLLAFDRPHAEALGYRVALLDLVLNVTVALTVVVAVRAVGTVLVVAFVVTPAAAARLLGRSVGATMAIAVALATLLGWIGLSASFEASVHHGVRLAAGATVVVAFTAGFCLIGTGRWLVQRRGLRLARPEQIEGVAS
jgi:manganese/iron transport system permease protein